MRRIRTRLKAQRRTVDVIFRLNSGGVERIGQPRSRGNGGAQAIALDRLNLILGLPGDTVDSIRRGLEYLDRVRPFTELQVFNLSILPGTAFRQTYKELGLEFQPRPPYYVLKTPTLIRS